MPAMAATPPAAWKNVSLTFFGTSAAEIHEDIQE